jgi:uncharacterized membrane protein YfcA
VIGAVVQGSIGFGYALVLVPTLLLVAPASIPVTPLTVAAPMVLVRAFAERRALDAPGFARSASPGLEVAAGFASGVAGTVGAVGGPYLGLAYADRPGPVLRATVSMAFAVGVAFSLLAVGVAGEITSDAVRLGLALVPCTLAGLFLGRRTVGRLDGAWLRPLVLAFAGVAGVGAGGFLRQALGSSAGVRCVLKGRH